MIEYEYAAANQLTQRILNGSDVTNYEYDNAGRLARTTHTGSFGDTTEHTFTYDAAGQLTVQIGANSIRQNYTYDNAGRLTSIVYTDQSGAELDRIDYTYDQSGHLLARTRTNASTLNETPLIAEYDEDNRLLTLNGFALAYDDNGNLIEQQTETGRLVYQYNNDNRLIRSERYPDNQTEPETTAEYEYDRDGRRIAKTVNGEKILFAWDGNRLIAEYDHNNNLLKRYTYGIGHAPPQVIDQNGIYDVHTDHPDTPQTLTDQNGNVPDYQDADGDPLVLPVRGGAPSLHQLCLKHGRDTTTRAIADALVRGGSAEWVTENDPAEEKARLQFKRSIVQEENFSETDIVIMTQVGADFSHSYQQALNPKIDPQPKFIEAYFNDIDPAKRGDAAKWARGEMDMFSRKIADGLKAFRSADGKGVRMGVGAYSFEGAELILDKEQSDDE